MDTRCCGRNLFPMLTLICDETALAARRVQPLAMIAPLTGIRVASVTLLEQARWGLAARQRGGACRQPQTAFTWWRHDTPSMRLAHKSRTTARAARPRVAVQRCYQRPTPEGSFNLKHARLPVRRNRFGVTASGGAPAAVPGTRPWGLAHQARHLLAGTLYALQRSGAAPHSH